MMAIKPTRLCGLPLHCKHLFSFLKPAKARSFYCTAPNSGQNVTSLTWNERKISVDGLNINVREEGNGNNVVVCLPGLIGSIETDFAPILPKMNKDSLRIISWDPPGQGKSRPPDRRHEVDFYRSDAQLVAQLMKTLGHDKYSILGWSNGGVTGYSLAARFPERVDRLVLWGSHAFIDARIELRDKILSRTDSWSKENLEPYLKLYGKAYLDKLLGDWNASCKAFGKLGGSDKLKERILSVRCPTLVIHGEEDAVLTKDHAQYLAQNIKNCKMHTILGGKHDVHFTNTKEFLNLVKPFLLS